MSEIDNFKQQVKPAKRRSKFDPYLAGIQELQREGYSLEQICEWLWKDHQVGDLDKKTPSSKQVLSAYLQRRKGQVGLPSPAQASRITSPGLAAPGSESAQVAPSSVADALDADKRQERAKSYVDDNSNPFFKKRKPT